MWQYVQMLNIRAFWVEFGTLFEILQYHIIIVVFYALAKQNWEYSTKNKIHFCYGG